MTQGCKALGLLIRLAYKRNFKHHPAVQGVLFTSSHDKEEAMWDHMAIKINSDDVALNDLFFDISGSQTLEEMKLKLGKLWQVESEAINHRLINETFLAKNIECEYCADYCIVQEPISAENYHDK